MIDKEGIAVKRKTSSLKFKAPEPVEKKIPVVVIQEGMFNSFNNPALTKLVEKSLLDNPVFKRVSLLPHDTVMTVTYWGLIPGLVAGPAKYLDWEAMQATVRDH